MKDFDEGVDMIAVLAQMVDARTKNNTQHVLQVTMPATDAVSVAVSILHIAKMRRWPIPTMISEVGPEQGEKPN